MADVTGSPQILLIDTNLLLVFLVGATDRSQVGRAKRTREYTPQDYDLLVTIINRFQTIAATPNILTEVSNLAGQLGEPFRSRVFRTFAVLVSRLTEHYVPSQNAVHERHFVRLGMADVSVLLAAGRDTMVVTDDLDLYLVLAAANAEVVNFTHVRAGAWEF